MYSNATGALAEQGDAVRIAAEVDDVLVDPADRLRLVLHALVARRHEVLRAQEAERPQPVCVFFVHDQVNIYFKIWVWNSLSSFEKQPFLARLMNT